MLKLAHLSDLHFFCWPSRVSDYFSKRILSTMNHCFARSFSFSRDHLDALKTQLLLLDIEELWISGDLSVSGLPEEFAAASSWLDSFSQRGIRVRLIPGNHDHRGKRSDFFSIFSPYFSSFPKGPSQELSPFSLEKDRLCALHLSDSWSLLMIDLASEEKERQMGHFTLKDEELLRQALLDLASRNVAILCHFPLISNETIRRQLKRRQVLLTLLKEYPNVRLYLHGHTHLQKLIKQERIIHANAGATGSYKGSFNIFSLSEKKVIGDCYCLSKKNNKVEWALIKHQAFSLA